MTTSRVNFLLCAVLALAVASGLSTRAIGADLGYGASIKDNYAPPPPQRKWYLKGTIGMANPAPDSIWNDVYGNGFFTVRHVDMKTAPFFGLGIGAACNRWFRFDVTGEYRGKWIFLAQDSYSNAGGGTNDFTADMESWVGLANAYIDIGTWRGITPYVGAGIGAARLSVLGLTDVNVPHNGVAYGADNTEYNLAWALYAGVSYDVTPQFTVDLGYRYLDLGDVKSGPVYTYLGAFSYSGLEIRDVTSHDLMLSLRYDLDRSTAYPVAIK
jgi:opacity protein-like surface antigen